ncbi:cytochrome P450 [Aspergillus foveolatus]|uniref:cytochrome P450 n=1 Tax=Aspergillus foveolatus TaxID=210207 RepID=UPI003CCDD395
MNETINLMLDKFDHFSGKQQPFEFDHWFNYLAFDIVGEVVFSQRFSFIENGKDIGGSIANSRSLNAYITAAGYFQWLHKLTLGNPLLSKLNLLPNKYVFNTAMAALHRRETNPHARNDMVEHWKRTLKEHSDGMTITHVQAVATGTPQYLETLRAEIAAERAQGRCNDPIVEHGSLGVFSPVPFGLARVAPKGGLSIGERHFFEDKKLSVNPWVVHYNIELFGQDAAEYNPDRLIGERAKRIEKYFMPFGHGYNSCPGRHLATIELSKVIATLVRDYDTRQQNPGQSWKYMAYFTAVP